MNLIEISLKKIQAKVFSSKKFCLIFIEEDFFLLSNNDSKEEEIIKNMEKNLKENFEDFSDLSDFNLIGLISKFEVNFTFYLRI